MIRVSCQTCGSQFDTDDRYAGQTAKCPNCDSQIVIPRAAASTNPSTGGGGGSGPPAVPQGRPGKVTAIGIMTLVGGVVALIVSFNYFFFGFWLGIGTFGIGCILFLPAVYSLALAIVAVIKGILILGAQPQQRSGPLLSAIMQIVNVISLDLFNVALGVIVLVFASDPQVKAFFRR